MNDLYQSIRAMPLPAAGWQPIETAPRDGSSFLAYARDPYSRGFYGVAQWAEKQDWNPRSVAGWFWPFAIRPTHWVPFPAPPEDVK